jgi:hypothetical protein
MNTYENNTAPNALDYLGNYLKKEDVLNPQVVRVIDIYKDELPGESRSKLVATFAEFGKPMVLNTTNIKRFVKMFGTTDTGQWRGEVTLYVDHDIEFGGKTVGGLRVRPAKANGPEVASEERSKAAYQADEEDFV